MPVRIQLTDKYWLGSDRYSWMLTTHRMIRKKGQVGLVDDYPTVSFWPRIADVLQGCLEMELRQSEAKSLEELAEIAVGVRERLVTAIKCLDQYQQAA